MIPFVLSRTSVFVITRHVYRRGYNALNRSTLCRKLHQRPTSPSSSAMGKTELEASRDAFRIVGRNWSYVALGILCLYIWHEKYVSQEEAVIPAAMPESAKSTAVATKPHRVSTPKRPLPSREVQKKDVNAAAVSSSTVLSVANIPTERHILRIETALGDISDDDSDVMVNDCDANITYFGDMSSSMSYSLARRGGKELQDLSSEWVRENGPLKVAQTAIHPTAGTITSKWLISVRTPGWRGGKENEAKLLEQCVRNVLRLANEQKLETVVMGPMAMSTLTAFPARQLAQLTFNAIRQYAQEMDDEDKPNYIKRVRLITPDSKFANMFSNVLEIEKKKWDLINKGSVD